MTIQNILSKTVLWAGLLLISGPVYSQAQLATDSVQQGVDTTKTDSGESFTLFGHHFEMPGIFHFGSDSSHHDSYFTKYRDSVMYHTHHLTHVKKYHSGLYHFRLRNHDLRELFDDVRKESGVTMTYVGKVDINTTFEQESFSLDYLIDEVAYQNGMLAVQDHDHYIIYGLNAEDIVGDKKILYTFRPKNLDYVSLENQVKNLNIKAETYTIPEQNALLLNGTLTDVKDAVAKYRLLDRKAKQVSIELLIVEYNHGDAFDWGFDVTSGQTDRFSDIQYNPQSGLDFAYNFLTQLSPEFKVNLRALVANNYANVVTNPHLVTRNNEKATIDITERRYVQLQTASINGITTALQNVDVGIQLDVTPKVMNNENVLLTVSGKNSVFLADQSTASINTLDNTINTSVMVKNGETLIIGGLIQAEESDVKSGVPVLRYIPVLNLLFQGITKNKNYIETVIYITVYHDPLRNDVLHKSGSEYKRLEERLKREDKRLNRKGIRKVF